MGHGISGIHKGPVPLAKIADAFGGGGHSEVVIQFLEPIQLCASFHITKQDWTAVE